MRSILAATFALTFAAALADDDADYTAKIKEYTTEPFFLTELVDHLPASDTVPAPDKVLGYVIGTPNKLTYSADCARYLRELEKASPRIKVFSMGRSEGGREMVVAVISDEANMAQLNHYKDLTRKLSDPRKVENADSLVDEALPFYWATGAMHSPESGSPEMLMELAYRLVVEDTPFIQDIRKNSFVMMTPVLETDGRDRYVDTYYYRKQNPKKPPIPLIYWGEYVSHDDNRDGMALSLAMSKNLMKTWLDFHPQVLHDLHESEPYLYISTGTGPYNSWLDPITIDEWHILAYNEVDEMTKRGVPGVWTHGFYDGWAPNYAFYAANGHNAIGRFYETFGGGGADTAVRSAGDTDRQWYRPNPPFDKVRWSIRNNINLQESALLLGLHNVAVNKDKYLHNYLLKTQRSIQKARAEGPAAYVFPSSEKRIAQQRSLLDLLRRQGVEIQKLDKKAKTEDGEFDAGSYVVRMDQPYSRMADMLLDKQFYSASDPAPYDDTGWTLGPLFNVQTVRCTDVKILDAPMSPAENAAIEPTKFSSGDKCVVIPNIADFSMVQLRYALPNAKMYYAKDDFDFKLAHWPAGSVIIDGDVGKAMKEIDRLGIEGARAGATPKVAMRETSAARIALVHNWQNTQNDGWYRIALDQLGIPYKYVPLQKIRDTRKLKDIYDVIILPPVGGAQSWLHGVEGSEPIPWMQLPGFKNIGGPDSIEDIRGGFELEGVMNLRDFVDEGGLLVTVGSSSEVPITFGLARGLSVTRPSGLQAPGGVFLVENADDKSPVTAGYAKSFGVYFDSGPLLTTGGGGFFFGNFGGGGDMGPSRRGGPGDKDVVQGRGPYEAKSKEGDAESPSFGSNAPRPKILVRFAKEENLLISGMLQNGNQLAGTAAVASCKLGKGHILMFAINPMWRMETCGSYELLFNAAMNWKDMD
jgi:hypothetical protein